MPKNIWWGYAPAVAQVTRITDTGDANPFELYLNGKPLGFADEFDATAIVLAFTAKTLPEFQELTATEDAGDVLLTARTAGVPFVVSATHNGSPYTAIETETESAGPLHFDDSRNWSAGHIPDSGEEIVFEQGSNGPKYGLRQAATFTANHTDDEITVLGDFRVGQVVRLRTTNTLPAGLAIDTDYVVSEYDRDTGVMTLEEPDADPVTFTNNGTGTHTIAVEASGIEVLNQFTGPIGLPRLNVIGYREYRPTALQIGLLDDAPVVIGQGPGSGSGLIRLDTGIYPAALAIQNTGGSTEMNIPALNWTGTAAGNSVEVLAGDVGIGFFADQEPQLLRIEQRGGRLQAGEGLTFDSSAVIEKTGGELKLYEAALTSATLRIRA